MIAAAHSLVDVESNMLIDYVRPPRQIAWRIMNRFRQFEFVVSVRSDFSLSKVTILIIHFESLLTTCKKFKGGVTYSKNNFFA